MVKSNILKIESVQQNNMNCIPYMILHRRMYAVAAGDDYLICLSFSDASDNPISISVTKETFNEFLSYEIDFKLMLDLFSSLLIKFASIPMPF